MRPKGPPQFLWLATRWDNPDARNPEEVIGIVDLRDRLAAHVKIAQKQRDSWSRVRTAAEKALKLKGGGIGSDAASDAAEKALEGVGATIPYGGLITKVVKTGYSLFKEGLSASQAHSNVSEQIEKTRETASDLLLQELREVFGGFGSGGLVLPTILFLDDAQWIDRETLRFIHLLWDVATQNNWPLLVVVTRWEREWNELTKLRDPARDETLCRYKWIRGAELWLLPSAEEGDLRAYLLSKFPGLTTAQQALILDKAAGNFWTLVLNVGALESRFRNCFLNSDRTAALTEGGERLDQNLGVGTRAAYRATVRRTRLSNSGYLGLVKPGRATFSAGSRCNLRRNQKECKCCRHTPNARHVRKPARDIGCTLNAFREFRDRAFHDQGQRYFNSFLAATDEVDFVEVLRDTLAGWINRSFNEHGDLLVRQSDTKDTELAPDNSVAALSPNEARYLLALSRRELQLPAAPTLVRYAMHSSYSGRLFSDKLRFGIGFMDPGARPCG